MQVIPKNSHIYIGPHPQVCASAVGVVFSLKHQIDLTKSKEATGYIIESPNGWGVSTINHEIDLKFDHIVKLAEVNNNEFLQYLNED
jgi:hypothetical protein